jgi:hypothetical protein
MGTSGPVVSLTVQEANDSSNTAQAAADNLFVCFIGLPGYIVIVSAVDYLVIGTDQANVCALKERNSFAEGREVLEQGSFHNTQR